MSDFYETLGVPPDADADAIKKAFRKKAGELHPDRSGADTGDAMAAVNKAYAVLIDPRRRQAYDADGDDTQASVADRAQRELTQAFAAAIGGGDDNVIVVVRRIFAKSRAALRQGIAQQTMKHAALEARRKLIRSKSRVNVAHVLIDHALEQLKAEIDNADEMLAVIEAAAKLLDDYESDEPVEFLAPQSEYGVRYSWPPTR